MEIISQLLDIANKYIFAHLSWDSVSFSPDKICDPNLTSFELIGSLIWMIVDFFSLSAFSVLFAALSSFTFVSLFFFSFSSVSFGDSENSDSSCTGFTSSFGDSSVFSIVSLSKEEPERFRLQFNVLLSIHIWIICNQGLEFYVIDNKLHKFKSSKFRSVW